jgi:glycosyltransferase involved in cell wall biosynthesis
VDPSFGILTVHEAFGSENSRENWRMTLEAFISRFGQRNSAFLTIKTWNAKADQIQKIQDQYDLTSRVHIMSMNLPGNAMADMYRQHFVFVKNSNKEGWSIPLTEAMACGSPVIVYDNPVLRENVRNYPNVSWFTKKEQLEYYFDFWYKIWRQSAEHLAIFSWKHSIELVEDALEVL